MNYEYTPKGVCARKIHLDIEDGIIQSVSFEGGCSGNGKGIAALCEGRNVKEVINLLEGTICKSKTTSCPDQLAKALKEIEG